MSLFEGDRYSEISVYSSPDAVQSIEIKTDLGASLSLGAPGPTSDYVIFAKASNDPLQFFGFEGFSTGGALTGFRTLAYDRAEYDAQAAQNIILAANIPIAEAAYQTE